MTLFYLASKSPRRAQILRDIGFHDFTVLSDKTVSTAFAGDEVRLAGESPEDYVSRTAREKALRAFNRIEKEGLAARPVLAADTAVILGTRILGKPENREEEIRFLKALSGTTHTVRTALVVAASPMQLLEAVSVSHVHFRTLTEEEIAWYSATKEPYDKAGGYAVQGLAAIYIDHIDGSFSGIMGLPAYQTTALLKTLGIEPSEN